MGDATQSIMVTIKKMLGVAQEYNAFNVDIMVNINSVFLTLNQLGVGPARPFRITGEDETWEDFLGDQMDILEGVQTYVYLKVRLLFDPPTNSFTQTAMQDQCKELEWRLNAQVEHDFNNASDAETPPADEDEPVAFSDRVSETDLLRAKWREVRRDVSSSSKQEPDLGNAN